MDKNAIKKFAVWARVHLMERVSLKAEEYGITEDSFGDENADSIGGVVLTKEEKKQRQALIAKIREKGYAEVMEEAAYTWFNRFCALRFMEVNDYLPSHIRVFTNGNNELKPEILAEAIHLEMEGLDMKKVFALKDADKEEELYKYLLVTQCNALSEILPRMFQKISDYTELLLPDHLLREGGVIEQMVTLIPEEDWQDAVQIIGWLYQYYNAQKKDEVFAALKKNVKITKENIPAATQLFTPDWIVRYMVENSLGRLWVEGHPDAELKAGWKYYLEEAEQEEAVEEQLAAIRKEYAAMTPEDIKVIDPCCGSGHILAYMFDVLMQIYEKYGYTTREAVKNILEKNLYGLDIDDRAAQLAYFSVMMQARRYDRRFFRHTVQPKVYAIQESNGINRCHLDFLGGTMEEFNRNNAKNQISGMLDAFRDAKEYGSILNIDAYDWKLMECYAEDVLPKQEQMSMEMMGIEETSEKVLALIECGEAMAQKYDVVVTNPPYMGGSGMSAVLSNYVKKHYPDSKADLFAVFIERCGEMTRKNGYQAMITQHSWMFLSSFEKLREKMLYRDVVNMAHLGARAFEEIGGEVVQTTSFVLHGNHIEDRKGTYCRLVEPTTQQGKEDMFLAKENRYEAKQSNFSKILGSPIAYWVRNNLIKIFINGKTIGSLYKTITGSSTGDNAAFLRFWHEVKISNIGLNLTMKYTGNGYKWIPCIKGGSFRRWYGNQEYIINWEDDGSELKKFATFKNHGKHWSRFLKSLDCFYKEGITWSKITSGKFCCRYMQEGFIMESAACAIMPKHEDIHCILALMNTKIVQSVLHIKNPTLNMQTGDIVAIPVINLSYSQNAVRDLTKECILLSKTDWDSFETSWDFKIHPLAALHCAGGEESHTFCISGAYQAWKTECEARFQQLKANEEELNRIFIEIYGLQDELTPEVKDEDVTVYRIFDTKADIPETMGKSKYALTKQDVIKSFVSYAVGCMFGRYSLDTEGLAFAGGTWDESKYQTFPADKDNIIPICDDEYFEDDIVGRFVKFVEAVYGRDTLEENLRFIADALGGKGQPGEVIRKYFLTDFFKDHCRTYQKRPIYWLFDSGKKNGFKALIYMHRYQPDTIARIRTDYVHEQQSRYRTALADLETRIKSASASERVKLTKESDKLKAQAEELKSYEEKIHHLADRMISIDLDDGVKKNYEIFGDVLGKIK